MRTHKYVIKGGTNLDNAYKAIYNETIASWEKDCDCQGLSTMPNLRMQAATRQFEECDLTGRIFSLKMRHIHAPVCQECHKEWRRTLLGNTI